MSTPDDITPHEEEARALERAAEALSQGTATDEQVELLGGKPR